MAAVNSVQRFIVRGLQPQFQPHFIALIFILAQQIKHRLRHAVRARADAQTDDIGLTHRLLVHRAQHLHFGKGAGIGLEIGQIAFCAVDQICLMRQLVGNRLMLLCFIGKRGDITERAAAAANSAVAVWAAESTMQRQFMDLFAVATRKIPTKHID